MDPTRITFDPGAARAAQPAEGHDSLDHVERMECIGVSSGSCAWSAAPAAEPGPSP